MGVWCDNELEVSGSDLRILKKFLRKNRDSGLDILSFEKLIPSPRVIPKKNWLGSYELSYGNWARYAWGSKSNVAAFHRYKEVLKKPLPGETTWTATFNFTTDGSAPILWLKRASEVYRSLDFKLWFDEPELEGAGGYHYSAGVLDEEETWFLKPSFLWAECAAGHCTTAVQGLRARERQGDLGKRPSARCCPDHQLVEAVLASDV